MSLNLDPRTPYVSQKYFKKYKTCCGHLRKLCFRILGSEVLKSLEGFDFLFSNFKIWTFENRKVRKMKMFKLEDKIESYPNRKFGNLKI